MDNGRRAGSRRASRTMALCGMMSALSVTLMFSGGLIPIATYCVPMAAGLLLLPILLEVGRRAALTTFAATALIGLLICPDKEAAFFYLFFGYYPVLKWSLDKIRNKPMRIAAKLVLFSALLISMYLILAFLMNMDAIVAEFKSMGIWLSAAFLLMFDGCMMLYDRLLLPMVLLYANRLRPRIRMLL